jgi:pimeloyl-ACP methyl ester carboxylesterase
MNLSKIIKHAWNVRYTIFDALRSKSKVGLVQLEGGGHGLMFQFPEKIAKIVETFLQVMI